MVTMEKIYDNMEKNYDTIPKTSFFVKVNRHNFVFCKEE